MTKLLCYLGIHNWSKDINERQGQFHTGIAECCRCDKRKVIYQDLPVKIHDLKGMLTKMGYNLDKLGL